MHLADYMVGVVVLDVVGSCHQYDCGAIELILVALDPFLCCLQGGGPFLSDVSVEPHHQVSLDITAV